MANAVYAPGINTPPNSTPSTTNFAPGRGPGGVFANFLMGATPKYAINQGFRGDFFKNTMARMFIRVDASEMNSVFLPSIGDSQVRRRLAPRIAGDPTRNGSRPGPNNNVNGNGYLDFLISQVQHSLQEKVQVSETLSDNYVAYFFGQTAPIWQYSGYLINTVQDDQASNMMRLYMSVLRGTQMARRQKSISLKYDSYIVNGVMTNIQMTHQASNELVIPFGFQLLVKRVLIVNYTSGWVPNQADTPFASDVNAIPYDGRPREERSIVRIAARTPAGTEPVRNTTADARVTSQPPASIAAAPPPSTLQRAIGPIEGLDTPIQTNGPPLVLRQPEQASPNLSAYSSRPETVNPPSPLQQTLANPIRSIVF